jgi:hypothetical protein
MRTSRRHATLGCGLGTGYEKRTAAMDLSGNGPNQNFKINSTSNFLEPKAYLSKTIITYAPWHADTKKVRFSSGTWTNCNSASGLVCPGQTMGIWRLPVDTVAALEAAEAALAVTAIAKQSDVVDCSR